MKKKNNLVILCVSFVPFVLMFYFLSRNDL